MAGNQTPGVLGTKMPPVTKQAVLVTPSSMSGVDLGPLDV